ncbi:hypothetical protein Ancab_008403 [Ancistrocladus abbreviatus]
MKSQNILVLTIILAVVIVATLSNVSAARLLSEDFNGTKDDFSKYNYVYETAKYNLTYWIQRLSSGSSGGGDVIRKEKVEETLAKPPTDDDDERASKLDNPEREYFSKNIYEDGRESSPSMMSSSRARENAIHVSSIEKVGLEHHGGGSSSLDKPIVGPVLATSESCTQDRPFMCLASATGDASAAHNKRKSKSNSCKKGIIRKGTKGILSSRPSKLSSSVRKSCKNMAGKGSVPELVHNQGPSFDSGSIVVFSSTAFVDAGRALSEDFSGTNNNHLAVFPFVYAKAKVTMGYWLERLASGPSGGGGGN